MPSIRHCRTVLLDRLHFDHHFIERGLDGVYAAPPPGATRSASAVARAISSSDDDGADRLERGTRILDGELRVRRRFRAQRGDGFVGQLHVAAERFERAHVGIELHLAGHDCLAQLIDAPPRFIQLRRQARCALPRARLPLPRSRSTSAASADARSTSAACARGVRGALTQLLRPLHALRTGGAAQTVSRSSASRCSSSSRTIDARASS